MPRFGKVNDRDNKRDKDNDTLHVSDKTALNPTVPWGYESLRFSCKDDETEREDGLSCKKDREGREKREGRVSSF